MSYKFLLSALPPSGDNFGEMPTRGGISCSISSHRQDVNWQREPRLSAPA